MYLPDEERHVRTKSKLLDDLTDLFGGRAAEQIAFNELSTGAQSDLERGTKIARKMVMEWGMSDKLGPMTFGRSSGEDYVFLGRDISRDRNYSEEVAATIDNEVRSIVESCYEKSVEVLNEHRDHLEALVVVLLEKETVNREEFEAIMAGEDILAVEHDSDSSGSGLTEQSDGSTVNKEDKKKLERIIAPKQEPAIGLE